jgi:hypothetical protein
MGFDCSYDDQVSRERGPNYHVSFLQDATQGYIIERQAILDPGRESNFKQ